MEPPPEPLALAWPEGAHLSVTSTTVTSAEVDWPAALGPVTHYRVTWPGHTQDTTTPHVSFSTLTSGRTPTHTPRRLPGTTRADC